MRLLIASVAVLFIACGQGGPTTPSAATAASPTAPSTPTETGSALVGEYAITFTADPACTSLPTVARTRSYSAKSGPPGLILTGSTFGGSLGAYGWNIIYTKLSGDDASLWFQDPEIWDQPTPESYVTIFGTAEGTLSSSPTSELPFGGTFTFCPEPEPDAYPECEVPELKCNSTHHLLTLTRK